MKMHKLASKEIWGESDDKPLEVTKSNIPIYVDIECFTEKMTNVTWSKIYNMFMQDTFPKDLEDVHAYININKSRIHGIACKYLVMPCVEAIQWITIHIWLTPCAT